MVDLTRRLNKAKYLLLKDEPYAELPDVLGYRDIDHQWERGYRAMLERAIRDGETGPSGTEIIDYPKSDIAVRPLARFEPRDRLIYDAMVFGLAADIDSQLPRSVYSYRWHHRRAEPIHWSTSWKAMQQRIRRIRRTDPELRVAHTDVSAFYEHIDVGLLSDDLACVAREPHIAEELYKLLTRFQGISHAWGLPQGPVASGILANLYLLPVDRFLTQNNISFVRYSDDMSIFHRDRTALRSFLIEINRILRSRRLTTASSKTVILEPEDATNEGINADRSSLHRVIELGLPRAKDDLREEFDNIAKSDSFPGRAIKFTLNRMRKLGDDHAVMWCLENLTRIPHVMTEVFLYLASTKSHTSEIIRHLVRFMDSSTSASHPITEQRILHYFLTTTQNTEAMKAAAWTVLDDKNREGYSREIAALCIGRNAPLSEAQLLRHRFEAEASPRVRRALLAALHESGYLSPRYLNEVRASLPHLRWICNFLADETPISATDRLDSHERKRHRA